MATRDQCETRHASETIAAKPRARPRRARVRLPQAWRKPPEIAAEAGLDPGACSATMAGCRLAASWSGSPRARAAALSLAPIRAARADDRVLHEYVPDVRRRTRPRSRSAQSQAAPDAIEYAGRGAGRARASGEQSGPAMVATPGDGQLAEQPGQRSPSVSPDRLTALEGSLDVPRRVQPVDRAVQARHEPGRDAARRATASRRCSAIATARGARCRSRARRRGAARCAAARSLLGRGDARLLARARACRCRRSRPSRASCRCAREPATDLQIERDAAGNFYAAARGARRAASVFVAFLTDAPRAYFGTELPHGPRERARAARAAARSPASRARARALRAPAARHRRRARDLADALAALTAHFRAFEESDAAARRTRGDIYLDLARGKKGICRHRAYAFVVTAHALGIPARFVQNEAHSWVEVELPRARLHAHRSRRRRARPDGAQRSRSAAVPAGAARSAAAPGRVRSELLAARPQRAAACASRATAELAGPLGQAATNARAAAQAPGSAAFMAEPTRQRARAPRDGVGDRAPLAITLDQRHASVLRGAQLRVSGRVQPTRLARGVAGLRIEVSLAADDRTRAHAARRDRQRRARRVRGRVRRPARPRGRRLPPGRDHARRRAATCLRSPSERAE